jgi:heme exporter protein C
VGSKTSLVLPILAALLVPAAAAAVFFFAPVEQTMGVVQKIFYFHLALALSAFLSFAVACGAGIMYLLRRQRRWDVAGAASVEIGVVFTTLVLLTGSLWGRPIWNTWWTWDPRLTTSLILWLIYTSCLVLRSAVEEEGKRATYGAVVAVAGFLDVPLVFLSARMFRSIHPTVIRSDAVGLEPAMIWTLLLCLAAFLVLWAALFRLRCSLLHQEARVRDLQFQQER